MVKTMRKTFKRRRTGKKLRGGSSCKSDTCEGATKEGYFVGGGKRRRKRTRNSLKSKRRSRRVRRRTSKKIRGGAFHGYSMWENAGPLESSGVKLTTDILTARRHASGNPMSQPIEFKYGFHNTPKV